MNDGLRAPLWALLSCTDDLGRSVIERKLERVLREQSCAKEIAKSGGDVQALLKAMGSVSAAHMDLYLESLMQGAENIW